MLNPKATTIKRKQSWEDTPIKQRKYHRLQRRQKQMKKGAKNTGQTEDK